MRLIFKYKINDKGEIIKRKTRLVAKGFTQHYGIDYKNTFAPTLKLDSIRIFTCIAARLNIRDRTNRRKCSIYLEIQILEHSQMPITLEIQKLEDLRRGL